MGSIAQFGIALAEFDARRFARGVSNNADDTEFLHVADGSRRGDAKGRLELRGARMAPEVEKCSQRPLAA